VAYNINRQATIIKKYVDAIVYVFGLYQHKTQLRFHDLLPTENHLNTKTFFSSKMHLGVIVNINK
jgi:hypothetical protein